MGSEQIHYEALRKQIIMDKRDFLNIKKRVSLSLFAVSKNKHLFYFKKETFATISALLSAL